jgi:hydrogenase maturation factor
MQPGKLPSALLKTLLAQLPGNDPRVVLGPGVGRDAAVIDTGGTKLLVAKTDPITLTSDQTGRHGVHVNANDIACLGATPAWFLATILLPEGASERDARRLFTEIASACGGLGVSLVGGHTEITIGLDRAIVCGAMLGEVERGDLVRPDGARPGDALILTKGIAIEGTGVLAREEPQRLRDLGVTDRDLAAARRYLREPGISVVADARAVCGAVRVHAMHDPTEGGLATALYEMAEASALGIVVEEEQIAVLPATRRLCKAAGLEALGMLASGALLVAATEEDCARAIAALAESGVEARRIGVFTRRRGVIMKTSNQRGPVPRFATDEVARFLSESTGGAPEKSKAG